MKFSVISPIYRGESMLHALVSRIEESVSSLTQDYEIILVNDCSPDHSWEGIKAICSQNNRVKGVNLSKNYGEQCALMAGLSVSQGDWVAILDCDLQNRPEEIPRMYDLAIKEGYDTVFASRQDRHDTSFRKLSSKVFNKVFSYFADYDNEERSAEFGVYSRKVVDAILSMGDTIKFFPAMAKWVGFNIGYLPVVHEERADGSDSSYTLSKLVHLASDTMIGFSNRPLKLTLKVGFLIVLLCMAFVIWYLVDYMINGVVVSGFTTLVISLWLIAGILISILGMLGIYIGKIFDQVKNRPVFIIKETINVDK